MIIKDILEMLQKGIVIKINKPEYMGIKAESVELQLLSKEPEKRKYKVPLDSVEQYTINGDD